MSNCVICKQSIDQGQEIMTTSGPVHYGHCFKVFTEMPVTENDQDQNALVEATELLL